MSRHDLILTLAVEDLAQMALAGELGPDELWAAMEGAEKYREAMRRGDIAPKAVAQARARTCAACLSATTSASAMPGVTKGWCGPRLKPALKAPRPTCACFVFLRVAGVLVAGAKPRVASASCPQSNWAAVTVRGRAVTRP